jgi:elongation factor P hydroxylase
VAWVAVVSLVVIVTAYDWYEEGLHRMSHAVLASRRRLALFVTVILICPLLLLLL